MPGEEGPTEPATIVEPQPMGLASEIPSVSPQAASTERGGFLQKILSKLPFLKRRNPESVQAASARTSLPPEMPPASPPQTEAPPTVSPPTPGTSTT